jgi:hypothetical protein
MLPPMADMTHEGFAQDSDIVPGVPTTGEDPTRMPAGDDPSWSNDHFNELKY